MYNFRFKATNTFCQRNMSHCDGLCTSDWGFRHKIISAGPDDSSQLCWVLRQETFKASLSNFLRLCQHQKWNRGWVVQHLLARVRSWAQSPLLRKDFSVLEERRKDFLLPICGPTQLANPSLSDLFWDVWCTPAILAQGTEAGGLGIQKLPG